MSVEQPYIIRHIQLQENCSIEDEQQYYFLCWDKDIPMGHFFVEANEKLSAVAFRERVQQAVAPAVNFYGDFDHRPATGSDISVIICTRNRSEDLRKCLLSL